MNMMELVRQFVIFVILIISVRAADENSTLEQDLPPNVHVSKSDTFMTRLIKTITVGSPQCNSCNATGGIAAPIPNMHSSKKSNMETAKLVKFHCVKANSADVFLLDLTDPKANSLESFDSRSKFAFLIHGFTDSYPGHYPIKGTAWMQRIIIDWAGVGVNVCAVNWGALSRDMFNYVHVAQVNTERVARYLVEVLIRFEALGMNISETTLAGHSLGGQIVGKAGFMLKSQNKTLGFIYGLDPAGPCFTYPCLIDEEFRLDASDANHVQCIHTNIGELGQVPRCGCQDFYVNGGGASTGIYGTIKAHYLACIIFDWTLAKSNKCKATGGVELIGIHSQNTCGSYELQTKPKRPYCAD